MALRMTLPQFFSWAVWAAEGSEYLEKLDATHPGSSAHVPPTGTHPDLVPLGNRERPHRYRPVCGTMRRLFCGLHGGLMLGQFGSFDQLGPPGGPRPPRRARPGGQRGGDRAGPRAVRCKHQSLCGQGYLLGAGRNRPRGVRQPSESGRTNCQQLATAAQKAWRSNAQDGRVACLRSALAALPAADAVSPS